MPRLLVTGATGFVGRRVGELARARGWEVRGTSRSGRAGTFAVGELGPECDWSEALAGVDVVIHLAARVHVMNETDPDPEAAFLRANVEGTARLADQAASCGVKRFVFVSTVKVNGESTSGRGAFNENDPPHPEDPYAISKWQGEERLKKIGAETGMEIVVVRPPLVYGPGVKANFERMMKWVFRGVLLPLGAVTNKRSLVALDNLADLLLLCAEHPVAGNQTFMAGDGEDLSTTELLRQLARALNRPSRMLAVPPGLLALAARALGKRDLAVRVLGSLQVDISKARSLLGWQPPTSVENALAATARHYLEVKGR